MPKEVAESLRKTGKWKGTGKKLIAELGHFTLILALVMATFQTIFPLVGAQKSNNVLMEMGKPAAIAQFFTIFFAFLCTNKRLCYIRLFSR